MDEIKIKCRGADHLPVQSLIGLQGNLKTMRPANLEKLISSILAEGFIAPIFIWKDGEENRILDGHGRLKALEALAERGYIIPPLPVDYIEAESFDDARRKLLKITSQFGDFELDVLEKWVDEIGDDIIDDIRLSGEEIILSLTDEFEETSEDDALQEEVPTITKNGDLWELGRHRLMCGSSADKDTLDILLRNEKYQIVVTDPPYGVAIGDKNKMLNSFQKAGRNLSDIKSDNESPEQLKKTLLPIFIEVRKRASEDCTFFVTAPQGGELGMMMMMMKEASLTPRHVLMWYKNAPTFSMGRLDYDYQHEPILMTWGRRHKKIMKGEHRSSVWKIDKPRSSKEHPTMKPVELYVNAYMNNAEPNDISFEPFAGSGTAIIASEKTGISCRAVEIDPHFCDVIVYRFKTWMEENGREVEIRKNGEVWNGK